MAPHAPQSQSPARRPTAVGAARCGRGGAQGLHAVSASLCRVYLWSREVAVTPHTSLSTPSLFTPGLAAPQRKHWRRDAKTMALHAGGRSGVKRGYEERGEGEGVERGAWRQVALHAGGAVV